MSKLPVNQVRLTNIAVVRMKIKGKRFEIACYKNKVLNWRNKIERDLDETLQSRQIFTNVSKAIIAKTEDLVECFGTADHDAICKIILEKGEAQVSEKERQVEHDSKLKDIATIVADKTINRDTSRPFPVSMIESSMKAIHFSVHPTRSAKQQALELIRQLKSVLHIDRAQMRVRLEAPQAVSKQLKAKITAMGTTMEHEEFGSSTYEVVLLLDPGSYRELEESFKTLTKGKGRFDIVDMKVQQEGDIQLEEEQAALEARAAGMIPEEDAADSTATNLTTMRIVEPPSDTSQARADAIAKSQALKPIKKMIDSDDEGDRRKKKKVGVKKQVDEDEEDVKSQSQPKKKERPNKAKKAVTESDESDDETQALGMAKKRSAVRKQMKKKKQHDSSDDEEEDVKPTLKTKPATKATPAKKRESSSEDESDNEPASKKKPAPKKKAVPKQKQESTSEEESDDEKPTPKAKAKPALKKPAKKAESSDESESEEEKPKVKAKPKDAAKPKPKKQSSSSDDEEETTSKAKSNPKSAAKKKGKQRSDSDDD